MSTIETTAGKRPADALPSATAIGFKRIGIELRQFFRDKEAAVFTFALPMLLLVVFGSVIGGVLALTTFKWQRRGER